MSTKRIALIGSYGNGKSTLAAELHKATGIPIVHASPMQYETGGKSVRLDNCSVAELFDLTLRRHTERLIAESQSSGNYLSDGSLMHEWIYCLTRLQHGLFPSPESIGEGVTGEPLEIAEQMLNVSFAYGAATYTTLILLPNERPLADDPAPISEHFRLLLNNNFKLHLNRTGMAFQEVSGPIEQRVRDVIKHL